MSTKNLPGVGATPSPTPSPTPPVGNSSTYHTPSHANDRSGSRGYNDILGSNTHLNHAEPPAINWGKARTVVGNLAHDTVTNPAGTAGRAISYLGRGVYNQSFKPGLDAAKEIGNGIYNWINSVGGRGVNKK